MPFASPFPVLFLKYITYIFCFTAYYYRVSSGNGCWSKCHCFEYLTSAWSQICCLWTHVGCNLHVCWDSMAWLHDCYHIYMYIICCVLYVPLISLQLLTIFRLSFLSSFSCSWALKTNYFLNFSSAALSSDQHHQFKRFYDCQKGTMGVLQLCWCSWVLAVWTLVFHMTGSCHFHWKVV